MNAKLTIAASHWKKALAVLSSVVSNKVTLPILADVVLKYDGPREMFTMTCSDGETWITLDCADADGKPWMNLIEDDNADSFCDVAIPFAQLKDAVSLLPSEQLLQVEFSDKSMIVNYGIGEMEMGYQSSDTFPMPIPVAEKGHQDALCRFTLDADQLLKMMAAAIESSADDELRMVMTGVCLDVYNDKVIVVATNSHELFKDVIEKGIGGNWLEYSSFPAFDPDTKLPGSAKLLVAKRTRKALSAAIGGNTVTVTADKYRIEFKSAGVCIAARLIEGQFPNYEAVIPNDSKYRITMSRDALKLALRRVQLSANESTNMVELRRDDQQFVVSANNDDGRYGQERVDIHETDVFLPDGFSIGLKISTAVSILDRVQTDSVVLLLSDPRHPALYRPDDIHSSRLLLQMPMMV